MDASSAGPYDALGRKALYGLIQSQKMEAIGQLAGGVAHDFNNLLIVISGYSNNLLDTIDKANPQYKNIFQIKKAADRAATLTRQLLAFSRKQILQPKLFDINHLIQDMEKMLKRLIGENIILKAKLESGLNKIMADPGQFEQVLMNLVVNAKDAMPEGGNLLITTESALIDSNNPYPDVEHGDYILLKISDSGTGIDDKIIDRIFEPFYTTKDKDKGTGLGLSTVYGIVEQSGCHITVDSQKNVGTSFNIFIPMSDQIEEEIEIEELQSHHNPDNIGGVETILVVEDEEQVRELVIEMLELKGYNVLEASNGKNAIDVYNNNIEDICLILTDVVMPEMGGKKMIENLVNFKEGTKIIYMSGYTDNAIDEQGILDPGTEFIQKPFSPFDLVKKIRQVLDS